MSIAINISLTDRATPEVKALIGRCSPQRLASAVGPAVARLTRRHFVALPHNKRGWKPVNFWAQAARSTSWSIVPDGVVISVNKIGVRQRLRGGRISPVNARALAIPITEAAYGKVPSDFPEAFLLRTRKGAYLVQGNTTLTPKGRTRKGVSALQFLFKLSSGVDQAADPTVIPSDAEYLQTASSAIAAAVLPKGGT